jgi:polyhydroxybutyrate depolymerase
MSRGIRVLSIAAACAATLVSGRCLALQQMSMAVSGQPRSYLMERPAAPGPLPTMIVLHGLGGSAEETARGTGLAPFGDQQGFVTVFPDGINHAWNHLPAGKTPPAYIHLLQSKGLAVPDDVAFLRMLVADLVRRGISDPRRIYLTGISAGGFMTLRMTCVDPDLFAGIALVISGMPEPTGEECHPAKPMPVVMIKGTADPNVPWDGGFVKVHTFSVWPQERLFGFLRRLDGCADASEQSVLPNQNPYRVELVRWTKCSSGDPVILYRVINGVHAVPPVPELRETLWTFLRDKSR